MICIGYIFFLLGEAFNFVDYDIFSAPPSLKPSVRLRVASDFRTEYLIPPLNRQTRSKTKYK